VSRVNNGASANRSDVFANRGAEIWFEAKPLIEEKKMILPEDPVFIQQATNRWVEFTATQKLRVESKDPMCNRGVSSPDRGDSVFGAMVSAGAGGAITAETLKWIKFGSPSARFFDGEPVRFE
jgi:hypothetical protein